MDVKRTLKLIHYGSSAYSKGMFMPISDIPFRNKPSGGLWTSPVGSKYGWCDFCNDNDFGGLSQKFEVDFKGTILEIDSVEDMNELPWINVGGKHFISFQALCAIGFTYDAIHLTERGEKETRYTMPRTLYGWDCETVLLMNPDSIIAA